MKQYITVYIIILKMIVIGNVMCKQNIHYDGNYPEGEDFKIVWYSLYQINGENRYLQQLSLVNMGKTPLPSTDWALYFNSIPRIKTNSITPTVKLRRINGHFYELKPSDNFKVVGPGDTLRLKFETHNPAIKESDIPSGFYFVFSNEKYPQNINSVVIGAEFDADQTLRSSQDKTPVPTPESGFLSNKNLTRLPHDKVQKFLPSPVYIVKGKSQWKLDKNSEIYFGEELENEATFLARKLKTLLGKDLSVIQKTGGSERSIVLMLKEIEVNGALKKPGDQAYHLKTDQNTGVLITATDNAGIFYGIQSFLAMIPVKYLGMTSAKIMVDEVFIKDAPRYLYRGLHLDVARNFQSKETVLKFLDLMAFYKLNKFHFHLTDDEGWRLEIKSLPELIEVGGQRGHTLDDKDRLIPSFGSGPNVAGIQEYYSQTDYIDILKYAHDRHIEVIPEIDFPGHARAAIKAMEARYHRLTAEGKAELASAYRLIDPNDTSEYHSAQNFNDNVVDVCLPSTYRFLEKVIDEMINMHNIANVPLKIFHVGGDEVPDGAWTKSPACSALINNSNQTKDLESHPDYFLEKIYKILSNRGLQMAGWEEIALSENEPDKKPRKVPSDKFQTCHFIPYVWNTVWGWGAEDLGYRLANAGYRVVLCNAPYLYFDCAYNKHPKEPGLYYPGFVNTQRAYEFEPYDIFLIPIVDRLGHPVDFNLYNNHTRLSESGKNKILGIQGQLWGEEMLDSLRLEYMAFPKILGLAERAWAKQPGWSLTEDESSREEMLKEEWNNFVNCVGQQEMVRLDHFNGGVAYRIPPPGAVIKEGYLQANVAYPGIEIHYTTDGTDPSPNSPLYKSPIPVEGTIKLRSFNSLGRGSRIATVSTIQ